MRTYTDEYLNYYADQFVSGRLDRHGVTLDQYLAAPQLYDYLALMPFPLLPAQQAVKERIETEEAARVEASVAHLVRRNGQIVEPLHHHRHHRRRSAAFFPRGGKA